MDKLGKNKNLKLFLIYNMTIDLDFPIMYLVIKSLLNLILKIRFLLFLVVHINRTKLWLEQDLYQVQGTWKFLFLTMAIRVVEF